MEREHGDIQEQGGRRTQVALVRLRTDSWHARMRLRCLSMRDRTALKGNRLASFLREAQSVGRIMSAMELDLIVATSRREHGGRTQRPPTESFVEPDT